MSAERKWCHPAVRKKLALGSDMSSACAHASTGRKADASGNGRLQFRNDVHDVSGSPGTGKSHLAQAIGQAAIQQGYRVLYRETHKLLEDLADAIIEGTRKEQMELFTSVPLLIIDDLGMRKLPATAAEDLLEIVMRRYEHVSTLLTSNRPVEDWGKLLGDSAAVTAMLDRLLHHGHVLKCGPRSWRTKIDLPGQESAG
jgi:DNA replication protein DnaC